MFWWRIKPLNRDTTCIDPLDHIYVSLPPYFQSLGCHHNNLPSPYSSVKLLSSVTLSGLWVMSSSNETLCLSLSLFFLLHNFSLFSNPGLCVRAIHSKLFTSCHTRLNHKSVQCGTISRSSQSTSKIMRSAISPCPVIHPKARTSSLPTTCWQNSV